MHWLAIPALRFTVIFLLPCFIATFMSTGIHAATSEEWQQRRLEEGLNRQRALVELALKRESELEKELDSLNESILRQEENLLILSLLQKERRIRLELTEQELQKLQNKRKLEEDRIKKRLAASYQLGQTGLLNIIFSSNTLPELLDFQDNMGFLLEYEQNNFNRYRAQAAEIRTSKKNFLVKQEELKQEMEILAQEQQLLNEQRSEKARLLRRAEIERILYEQAAKEIERTRRRLNTR